MDVQVGSVLSGGGTQVVKVGRDGREPEDEDEQVG